MRTTKFYLVVVAFLLFGLLAACSTDAPAEPAEDVAPIEEAAPEEPATDSEEVVETAAEAKNLAEAEKNSRFGFGTDPR